MTEQEKSALLQFMGTVYGDAHKQDQMIVGQSGQLHPNSHLMKEQFEQVLKTPAQQPQQQNAPAPAPQEPVATPAVPQGYIPPTQVSVEQAQQELAAAADASQLVISPTSSNTNTTDQINTNQVEFDFSEPSKIDKLITLVEKQHLLLKKINIKLDNGKATKGSRQK